MNVATLNHLEDLKKLPPQAVCYCGWWPDGICPHCPEGRTLADKEADRGNTQLSSVCRCNDLANKGKLL